MAKDRQDRKWPPVDRYLVATLKEWMGEETPTYRDGMTPQDCLVVMAEKRGMLKVITKLEAISKRQRGS